jgi:hypothetical protein
VDRLVLSVDPNRYVAWPNGGGFQPLTIRVNDRELIEIIREIEQPFADAEWDRRVAAGESPDDIGPRGWIAGDYLYPNAVLVDLRGAPYRHGFELEASDPRGAKSLLLQCTCGVTDCWFLLARIVVGDDRVVWSEFCQFHRDWRYDLRFEFDRTDYERELARLDKAARPRAPQ